MNSFIIPFSHNYCYINFLHEIRPFWDLNNERDQKYIIKSDYIRFKYTQTFII